MSDTLLYQLKEANAEIERLRAALREAMDEIARLRANKPPKTSAAIQAARYADVDRNDPDQSPSALAALAPEPRK